MSVNKAVKPAKKLVQPCLPFKLIDSPGDDGNSICRKRKLCGTENDDLRVDNPKIELLNGGTKCFIKSEDENKNHSKKIQEIIIEEVVNNEKNLKEFVTSVTSLDNCIDVEEISDMNTTKVDENVVDTDDNNCTVTDSDPQNDSINSDPQNDSINSASDSGKIEKTPLTIKKSKHKGKRQESAKKQEEKLKHQQEKEKAREEKLEKQRLKQIEKEQKRNVEIEAKRLRELEKEREKKLKEEERKTKELEKERDKKQKEEERKVKELEKEKEKKQKEEERKAKELEKEKQNKEKILKEENEKKRKAAFVGFFKPKILILDNFKKDEEIVHQNRQTYFMPFQTKQDMKIAPSCRAYLNSDKKNYVDTCVTKCEENKDLLYLNLLKVGKYKPSKSEATWPVHVEDDTVILIETGSTNDENGSVSTISSRIKYCWKLLQFNENKRPPYWGTWRKKSLYVKPRRPFACDKIMFDYEIDSDDEWEEEDPGESIHGTDDDEEPEDDYEVDNDIFVPHGYLSDEEGDRDSDNSSKETQTEKLKLLGEEFEAEIRKKTERIKPRLVGCIWISNNVTYPENVSKSVVDTLLKYCCVLDNEEPIITDIHTSVDTLNDITTYENKKTALLPDSIIPDLITFVHGKTNFTIVSKNFFDELVKNGRNIVDDSSISLAMIKKTIRTIAVKSTHAGPWYVTKENFEKYGIEYPKNEEIKVPKSTKSTVTKITNFLKSQVQTNSILVEKPYIECDQNKTELEKVGIVPKALFNDKDKSLKMSVKEEQQVKIVNGKKRITPILISPQKKFEVDHGKKPREQCWSPEMKIACQGTSVPNDTDTFI